VALTDDGTTVCRLISPASGWLDRLSTAPDPVFAEGMMGDGLAIEPLAGTLQAPCDGEIIGLAPSGHAVTLRSTIGAEILMHVGIDTVALAGRGFTPHVAPGDRVAAGTLLLTFDMEAIGDAGKSLCTPVVIVNSEQFAIRFRVDPGLVETGAPLMEIAALAPATDDAASGPDEAFAAETVLLPLRHGLHARPSARLVAAAKPFAAAVTLSCDGRSADGRSVASLMALGAELGSAVEVRATGRDAAEAVAAIVAAIRRGLGETPVEMIGETAPPLAPPVELARVPLDGSATLTGVTGAPGTAIGPVVQFGAARFDYAEQGQGPEIERQRLAQALAQVRSELQAAAGQGKTDQGEILAAHLALLDDPELAAQAERDMAVNRSAEAAWAAACLAIITQLSALDNARLRERADDMRDIEAQVLASLTGKPQMAATLLAGAIIVADDLYPSQLIRLAEDGIAGICTVRGGATSHLSILAAGRNLPVLVATDPRVRTVPEGTTVVLAADAGAIEVAPSPDRLAILKQRREARLANQDAARTQARQPCATTDGVRVEVFANLGSSAGAAPALADGAEGCGLLRSEFLFMDRATPPDEAEQLAHYQAVANGLEGRPLVVRTLDIGGDKPVPFLAIPPEENPALGLRGVRLSLRHPDLLKTQFRALLRVERAPALSIMLPMVIDRTEIVAARRILDEARAELAIDAHVPLGIMVETPAAAMLADTLAREAHFFSIGTNDLTQYVLAIDRASVSLAHQSDGLHPAVLRSIRSVTEAGAASERSVGICGSLGGDILAIPVLIGLGLRRLSTTPSRIANAKAVIRSLATGDCQRIAAQALRLDEAAEVRALVRRTWPHLEDWI
jgi:phosphoenolpyruvate-protein phosphotransferase